MIRIAGMQGEAPKARRDLRREEMVRFGADIPWLHDPSLIPEAATRYSSRTDNPFTGVAFWMINQMALWSEGVHLKLDFAGSFNKHDLTGDQRVAVRESFQKFAANAFGPGIAAMSEIFSSVPFVAIREGKSRDEWGDIASKAKLFGAELSRDGTNTQVLTRLYLKGGDYTSLEPDIYDPSRLRLDDKTGISTITPITDLISAAKDAATRHFFIEDHPGVCVALQAPLEDFGGKSMFDAVWDAYSVAATTHIFPAIPSVDPERIPAQTSAETSLASLFDTLAHQQLLNLENVGIFLQPPTASE